ncbi:MAG: hypothetical protein K2K36_07695 [Muribaculaceae bacterium]|nr:hypothetical protein [Muribaculaceae bacterium]
MMRGECSNHGPFAIPAGSKFATVFTSFYDGTTVPSNIVELESDLSIYGSFDNDLKIVPEGLADGLYSLANDFHISPSGWGHGIIMPGSTRYCALVENNGSNIRFIESICPPETVDADLPDQLILNTTIVFQATLRNRTPRNVTRPVRVELIQNGTVKGWSPWVNTAFDPEGTIEFELKVDRWTWKDESISHAGDYVLCLSMRNSYGDIWIPMGLGKQVTVYDSAGTEAVSVDESLADAIYDLHGRRMADDVNSLSPGIYICRRNGIAAKIIRP